MKSRLSVASGVFMSVFLLFPIWFGKIAFQATEVPTPSAVPVPVIVNTGVETELLQEPVCGPTVHVSGSIAEDTWWSAGYVYVIDSDVTVNAGATLRIDSVVIKAKNSASLYINGDVLAVGTQNYPVYFTCLLYTSPSPRDRTRSRMPSSA